ncbi:Sec-independent protein translocase protein TatB [Andreprevotia chitinilytica]|uniref:Sec-independent protein translocase protein TatB n=1 Tax=Andreprevotia chitinilytica TaxID=396808 RepID=UPI00068A0015
MFDFSFGEVLVVGAVALVVLGPERLPKVARTVGALIGRAQRFVASVKADLDREMHNTELAKIEAELRAEGDALRNTIHGSIVAPVTDAHAEIRDAAAGLSAAVTGDISAPAPVAAHAEPLAGVAAPHQAEVESVVMPEHAPERDERQLDLFAPPPAAPTVVNDRR